MPMTLGARPAPGRRLPRAERREQILAAATEAFAAAGFAATSLDDVAAAAGISRAILYRHFDSKPDLYRAILDRVCTRLAAAAGEPGGFRLLFQHVAREPQFRDFADCFRAGMVTAAHQQIAGLVRDPAWARWAAQLAPVVAIEAITAWLDADQPDPHHAGQRIRHAIAGVIEAAQQA